MFTWTLCRVCWR